MSLLNEDIWTDQIKTGAWRSASATQPVFEPATGATIGTTGVATPDDVTAAASSAAEAQREWARRTPQERARVLRRAGDVLAEHADEVADWVMRESGATGAKGAFEAQFAAQECYESAGLPTHPHGEILPTEDGRWSMSRRRPVGVVSVIAPFNFPLILGIRSVAPALALGNAVLLKPDPRTVVSGGVVITRAFEEAGLPAGVLQLLPGDDAVGAAVVEAPEVRVISFTGSTPVGRRIGEQAAKLLKRAHLELGGNNALVVLPGANVAAAASAGAFGSYFHQGQICMTTGRHLVHESLVEEYAAALAAKADGLRVGDPAQEEVDLGPIIDARQLERISTLVDDSLAQGATAVAGGTADGPAYRPTVLTGVTPQMRAWREEIFGPVAPIMSFSTLDKAAELVNNCEFGLSVGLLGDVGMAMDLADRVESGKVHINEQTVADDPNAPFGGMKDSGTGSRFGGPAANLDAFTETQWLTVRSQIADYPF